MKPSELLETGLQPKVMTPEEMSRRIEVMGDIIDALADRLQIIDGKTLMFGLRPNGAIVMSGPPGEEDSEMFKGRQIWIEELCERLEKKP